MTLVDWLFQQIDLDEALAREGSRDRIYKDRQFPEGAHWTWVQGDDWDPVAADVADPDFSAEGLATVETFPSGPVLTQRGVEHEMRTHYMYAEVEGNGAGAAAHIINWDPARVLLESRSKRLIIRECLLDLEHREGGVEGSVGTTSWYVLTGMALGYRNRPGYRSEWRAGDE